MFGSTANRSSASVSGVTAAQRVPFLNGYTLSSDGLPAELQSGVTGNVGNSSPVRL